MEGIAICNKLEKEMMEHGNRERQGDTDGRTEDNIRGLGGRFESGGCAKRGSNHSLVAKCFHSYREICRSMNLKFIHQRCVVLCCNSQSRSAVVVKSQDDRLRLFPSKAGNVSRNNELLARKYSIILLHESDG